MLEASSPWVLPLKAGLAAKSFDILHFFNSVCNDKKEKDRKSNINFFKDVIMKCMIKRMRSYLAIAVFAIIWAPNIICAQSGRFSAGAAAGGVAGELTGSAAASNVARMRTAARGYYESRDVHAANYELGIENRKLLDENERQREDIELLKTRLRTIETRINDLKGLGRGEILY